MQDITVMTFTVPSYQKYVRSEIIVLQARKTHYHVLREHTLGLWVFQHASLARWVNIARIHREETDLKVKCFLFTLLKVPNILLYDLILRLFLFKDCPAGSYCPANTCIYYLSNFYILYHNLIDIFFFQTLDLSTYVLMELIVQKHL